MSLIFFSAKLLSNNYSFGSISKISKNTIGNVVFFCYIRKYQLYDDLRGAEYSLGAK